MNNEINLQQAVDWLSKQEKKVFKLIFEEEIKQKDIAYLLNLSPKTVSTYHSRILTKTGCKGDIELVKKIIKNNIIIS